ERMIAMIREDQRRWAGRLVSSALVFVCLPAASQAAAQEREPCPVAVPGAVVLYGEIPEPIVLTSEALAALPQVTAARRVVRCLANGTSSPRFARSHGR